MRIFNWWSDKRGKRQVIGRRPKPEGFGDFRGPYGFGRRAHRPDPRAKYGFENHPEPSPVFPKSR
jgi:hypothetical protein